jgi:hypothetical protein
MDTSSDIERFFQVALEGQTYLNILYLLLAFPLGLAYFIILVTGFSLGFGLAVIWIGLLILALMVAVWWIMAVVERQLAIWLLHEQVPPMSRPTSSGQDLWARAKSHLANPVTWKSLVYLFVKFPLGILSFVVVVTCLSLSAGLIAAPFLHPYGALELGVWRIESQSQAWFVAVIGVVVALLSMHLMNGLAWVSGRLARLMLGNASSTPAALAVEQSAAVVA